jgi:hypothetical protein
MNSESISGVTCLLVFTSYLYKSAFFPLELNRRHVVERLVYSSVVEPVEVVERGPFDVLDVAPRPLAMDQLGLVETVERLASALS